MAITSLWGYDRASRDYEVGAVTGVERMPRHLISNLLGLLGAIIGGVLGFYTFQWLEGRVLRISDSRGVPGPGVWPAVAASLDPARDLLWRGSPGLVAVHRVDLPNVRSGQ